MTFFTSLVPMMIAASTMEGTPAYTPLSTTFGTLAAWLQLGVSLFVAIFVVRQLRKQGQIARANLIQQLANSASLHDEVVFVLENCRKTFSALPQEDIAKHTDHLHQARYLLRFCETIMLSLESGVIDDNDVFKILGYRIFIASSHEEVRSKFLLTRNRHFIEQDLLDPLKLIGRLQASKEPWDAYVWGRFSNHSTNLANSDCSIDEKNNLLIEELNKLVFGLPLSGVREFHALKQKMQSHARAQTTSAPGFRHEICRESQKTVMKNRLLLELAFPVELLKSEADRPKHSFCSYFALYERLRKYGETTFGDQAEEVFDEYGISGLNELFDEECYNEGVTAYHRHQKRLEEKRGFWGRLWNRLF
ncbi:MAG: hypothetical protein JWO94_2101 [Verrucomicrobiaceae bacterium]|nr:hypothetical protein [Verrucomicrobiaceae bacterium]